jgi:hypothetical protein
VSVTHADLIAEWRNHAALCRRYGGDSMARTLEQCARELEETDAAARDTALTLDEAARASGFSAEHLGRLVRQGAIPNAGRKGVPRICRGDLPRRCSRVASERTTGYDPSADARSLVSRRSRSNG